MKSLRLNRSSTFVAAATAAVLTLLMIPGEIVSPLRGNFGGMYPAAYEHGWPRVFLWRTVEYDFSGPDEMSPDLPVWGVPWLAWDSWRFWESDRAKLDVLALMINFAAAVSILLGVALLWERRVRRVGRWWRFGLRDLLVVTLVVAATLGWWAAWRRGCNAEWALADALSEKGHWTDERYAGPLWLKRLVGEDRLYSVFFRVVEVSVDTQSETLAEDLAELPAFSRLERLLLQPIVYPDDDLGVLASLPRLKQLSLGENFCSEKQIEQIAGAAGLVELAVDLPASLRFRRFGVTNEDYLDELRAALPNCRITLDGLSYREGDWWAWDEDFWNN